MFAAGRLKTDFAGSQQLCRYSLCDEAAVATHAYTLQLQGNRDGTEAAAEALRYVLQGDPGSAQGWADLGDVLAQGKNIGEARRCFARAAELGTASAEVLVVTGDFYLQFGPRKEGLHLLRRVLEIVRGFEEPVFSRYSAREVRTEEVLVEVDGLPDNPRVGRAYLRYLTAQGDVPRARAVWDWVTSRNFADQSLTVQYSAFLAAQKLPLAAADAWASQLGGEVPGYRRTEYLFNGDLKNQPIPNAIFDWRIAAMDGVDIKLEIPSGAERGWLRIQFDGTANLAFSQVAEDVVLPPGKYRFRAYARSENLTTDQGLFFKIKGLRGGGGVIGQTERLLGSSGWHAIESAFQVGPAVQMFEVALVREPSLRFDNKIKGTVWIQEMSLVPQ